VNNFDPAIILGIFVLGGLGSALRLLISRWDGYLPCGILAANTVASFVAGFASINLDANPTLLLLVVIGLAGGLSTFSSWAGATVQMAARRKIFAPTIYTLLTLVLSSTAAYLGLLLG
jgi:CrcB protein